MRILIVEDEGVAAQMATTELVNAMPCEISVVATPADAIARLSHEDFHVTVVDMLCLAHSDKFEARRRNGEVRLTDPQLHLSGLAVLQAVRASKRGTAPVLWTNGEPNRRLHMMFAYEQLGCQVMCPKDAVGKLPLAVRAAVASHQHIDPVLRMHFPPLRSPSLRETFFASSSKLAVWRAMALGLHDHTAIARTVGVSAGTVRRGMDDMRTKLVAFDPGCTLDGPPTPQLVRYASQNWQFFLDDTVREFFP